MFTGLIERVGLVKKRTALSSGVRLELDAGPTAFEVAVGDSVAIDGVCLTATAAGGGFAVDVSAESLARSTLASISAGARVNLERALRLGDRLGGHLVTGHVDAVGRIAELRSEGGFLKVSISAPPEVMRLVVEKGSIAVDGISLTVNALSANRFHLTIIPETIKQTTLAGKRPGDAVNLETDLIGKYVARLLAPGHGPDDPLLKKLIEEGYIA